MDDNKVNAVEGSPAEIIKNTSPVEIQVAGESFMEVIKKKWYQSKTLIFNASVALIASIGPQIIDNVDTIKASIDTKYMIYFVVGVALLNMALRAVTNKPLEK